MPSDTLDFEALVETSDASVYEVKTKAPGPTGALPLTDEMLRDWPSGDLFGLSQNAGMGWKAGQANRDDYLILSAQGGLRAPDGTPPALGYQTGHWEVGLLVEAAAEALRGLGMVRCSATASDPCDGRAQGTLGIGLKGHVRIARGRGPGGIHRGAFSRSHAPAWECRLLTLRVAFEDPRFVETLNAAIAFR
jgi:hypothetical protein